MLTYEEALSDIKNKIETNDVIVFMKGERHAPQCGFSSVVVQILHRLNVSFTHVNVLLDPNIRSAIKAYSDWPTVPQLYIKQEFIGGCDIVKEMFRSKELEKLLVDKNIVRNS